VKHKRCLSASEIHFHAFQGQAAASRKMSTLYLLLAAKRASVIEIGHGVGVHYCAGIG